MLTAGKRISRCCLIFQQMSRIFLNGRLLKLCGGVKRMFSNIFLHKLQAEEGLQLFCQEREYIFFFALDQSYEQFYIYSGQCFKIIITQVSKMQFLTLNYIFAENLS